MKKYHFDLIIANPPYGSIGTSITEQVIQNIDYNEYVNLLPISDYQKGNTKVSNYVQNIEDIKEAFEDAAVTTSLAKISKSICNTFDSKQLKIAMMDLGLLTKFFRRNAELVELYKMPIRQRSFRGMENKFAVAIGHRDAANGHLPYSTNTQEYKFNHKLITQAEYEQSVAETLYGKPTGNLTSDPIFFDTKTEADNYKNFVYSKDGFRFTSLVWTTYSSDSSSCYEDCFPKVDWSRSWTPEEILVEYGYTDEEINQVMTKLEEFPGLKILD